MESVKKVKKKKRIMYIFMSTLVLILTVYCEPVYSWFSSTKKLIVSNKIASISHNIIELSNPAEKLELPDDKIKKIYKIVNTGTAPIIIRARASVYWIDSKGLKSPVNYTEVTEYFSNSDYFNKWYGINNLDWQYYNEVIEPNKESVIPFEISFKLNKNLQADKYSGRTISIEFEAESLQLNLQPVRELWGVNPSSYEYSAIEKAIKDYKKE